MVEYLPLQWWLATVFQAGDPGTAVMKIDPKQMSVNNEAEANLWLEQTLNENLTRASCHLDIDQRASSHPSPLLHLPLHNETLQPGNQGDSRYYNYIAPPLPFWRFFLLHWMLKPLTTYQLITLNGFTIPTSYSSFLLLSRQWRFCDKNKKAAEQRLIHQILAENMRGMP